MPNWYTAHWCMSYKSGSGSADRGYCFIQVNLFKKGLGVGVQGNQHDNTYVQGEIQRQIISGVNN